MEFVSVASVTDLQPDEMRAVNVNGKPILLVNLKGTFYAIGNTCTHMRCPLSKGTLKDENVECVCHGSMFNLKTGEVARGPAAKAEPKYDVRIEDGKVFVNT